MTRRHHRRNERFTSFRDEPLDLYEEDLDKKDYDDEEKSVTTRKYENKSQINILESEIEFSKNWDRTVEDLAEGRFRPGEQLIEIIKNDIKELEGRMKK